jgi:hypothetical protein
MNIKMIMTVCVLALLPGLAAAQCNGASHEKTTAMSCAEGMTLDLETGVCVEITTG